MQYEFRGKSLCEAVAKAVKTPPLTHKGSDSDSATVWSGGQATLNIQVDAHEHYTVEWDARQSNDEDYSITIYTDIGVGRYSEAFSGSGSWSFNTRNYAGPVQIFVEFMYAYSSLRRLNVSVS